MKRIARTALLVLLPAFAGGCASFSPYSVDESTVEKHISERITDFSRDLSDRGLPITLELTSADVAIGPEDRDVAVVDFGGRAVLQAPRIPIDLNFSVEGTPVYEAEEKAIYIRNLKVLSTNVEAAGSAFDLSPITGTLSDIASQFLNERPVYRLDEADTGARLFGMMNLRIDVQPGRLVLVPAGSGDDVQRSIR
ncbi:MULTISPECIES: DUF1439 domain-containing protein [Halomonadaceae]|uniref:DUF1439 domain-containing protein n=1 Tax=Vreelandella halophila TaxID=86177 RepID=A0A9X4YBD6_9GAMM|nr:MULTISPECIES: DUF1439 domain-containing protein [Halomonas]MYL26386.1 DUF1439 domain-containing protein [Halomonas utahensis]MYL73723.1 DUF1439 domain-containing protein [Halomonas sp. 22501_18_FS]